MGESIDKQRERGVWTGLVEVESLLRAVGDISRCRAKRRDDHLAVSLSAAIALGSALREAGENRFTQLDNISDDDEGLRREISSVRRRLSDEGVPLRGLCDIARGQPTGEKLRRDMTHLMFL